MKIQFATLHKLSAYLIAGFGLAALLFSREMTPPVAALVVIGFVASWFAEGRVLAHPRAPRIWNFVLVATLLVQIARAVLGESPVSVGVEFTAILQLSRLTNRKSARDYQQITVLAFLHLVAATVLVSDLSYAVCFVGFVLVAPWALSLGHLRREIEGNYLFEHRPGQGAAQVEVGRILASRRIVGPGFLASTAALALPLFALTASLFIVFPRIGLGFFSSVGRPTTRLTGFSDHIELGGFGRLRSDPTAVLRVWLPNSGTPRPERLGTYWRGTTFDRYDGHAWRRTAGLARVLLTDGRAQHLVRRFSARTDTKLHVFLEPVEPPVVFVPDRTVAISIPPLYDRTGAVVRIVDEFGGDELRYRDPSGVGLQYDVYQSPAFEPLRPGEIARADLKKYLQLPNLDPQVHELAVRITAGSSSDLDRAVRITRYLRRNYRYTLELPSSGDPRPLEEFLFRRKKGHCEYFSTALVVLLRSVGVPARNVSGFAGGELNRYGDFYTVRQSDAHSWAEVWLGTSQGWRTFDATPPARERPLMVGLGETIGQAVDALRLEWMQYVLSYSVREQIALSREAFGIFGRMRARLSGGGDGGTLLSLLLWMLPVVALAVVTALALRARRRRSHPGVVLRPATHAVRLYLRLEEVMRQAGHARPPSTPPLEHARRLREASVPGWELVERITARYVDARFGNTPLEPTELRALEKEISDHAFHR